MHIYLAIKIITASYSQQYDYIFITMHAFAFIIRYPCKCTKLLLYTVFKC